VSRRRRLSRSTLWPATNRAQIAQARAKRTRREQTLALARLNLSASPSCSSATSATQKRYDDRSPAEQVASADAAASQKALAVAEANLPRAKQRVKLQETRLANAELTRSTAPSRRRSTASSSRKSAEPAGRSAPASRCAPSSRSRRALWIEGRTSRRPNAPGSRVGLPATFTPM